MTGEVLANCNGQVALPNGNASSRNLETVFAMTRGDGDESYSKNSTAQEFTVQFLLPFMDDALSLVSLPSEGPIVVADLGCSSGPNTIMTMSLIVKKLRARLSGPGLAQPEFQAFFNDLSANDFNNLFQLLSTDLRVKSNDGSCNFFASGVPGSFYGRLFPSSSVNVFYSFHCLHWLSKIPDAVLDKKSPAFNKGRFWINASSLEVATAYKQQSALDLKNFLNARAAELVPGGVLFLASGVRFQTDPNKPFDPIFLNLWGSADEVWSDLILQGLLTEEQRDGFNFPMYNRSVEEIEEALESCISLYHVHKYKVRETFTKLDLAKIFPSSDPKQLSVMLTGILRGAVSGLLEAHIGKEAMDIFWRRYAEVVEKNMVKDILSEGTEYKGHVDRSGEHIMILIRK